MILEYQSRIDLSIEDTLVIDINQTRECIDLAGVDGGYRTALGTGLHSRPFRFNESDSSGFNPLQLHGSHEDEAGSKP